MKDEVAGKLLQELRQLPLSTTDRSATEHGGDLTLDEVRTALKTHDRVVGCLLTDAMHRRRDLQTLSDWRVAVDAQIVVRPDPIETTNHVALGVGLALGGGALLALHVLEIGAIVWLALR